MYFVISLRDVLRNIAFVSINSVGRMADKWFGRWKERIKDLKSQVYALYLAYRDPRVSWFAKAFGAMVLAYALSPIDLIPDFIPVIGYLDDIVLIPLGIMIAMKMIPKEIMEECKRKAVVALSRRV